MGFLHAPVVFRLQFDNDKKDDIFIIRFVRTRTQNDVIVSLRPKAPFKRPPIVSRRKDNVEVIPGKRLPRSELMKQHQDVLSLHITITFTV